MSSAAKTTDVEEKLKDIISSYQDLNEKVDLVLERIKTKKTKKTKK